ncbi:amino acid ABC transporter ATP-binding protein [Demequina sp. SO4-13]|uniref:amino acid ABC transporter ATP-binding protein n=1 Tax=Demequina sp. SO4-13 TaxID=3401027 RepID=UPI003AF8F2E0
MSPIDPVSAPDPLEPPPPARGSGPLLTVRGLRKRFGDHEVLRSVDLTVRRGSVLALIGPSGSGKTTALRCLNGLETADAGTIEVGSEFSIDLERKLSTAERAALRDRSAMVFQHYNLFPHKTVLENVVEGPIIVQRRPAAQARDEARVLLEKVGLADKADAYPFQLSGGQQQRVGIVRALALRPELLLFDEPTSALDPELVGDVLDIISELAKEGWTMVIVTHELQFARDVAHEVAFVDGGVIVEHGPAAEVLGNPRHARTQQFLKRLLR